MGFFRALLFTLFLSLITLISCQIIDPKETQTFIVHVQNDLKPSAFSDLEQWYISTINTLTSYTKNPPASPKKPIHIYDTVFHGFSARLNSQQAQQLQNRPEILGVFPDRIRSIQTTRSPQFLGLDVVKTFNSLMKEADYGSNVIIGLLDTGIWPERHSFHDEGMGPIPSHWKGECSEGEKFPKTTCNNKVIGARYFTEGYDIGIRRGSNNSVKSARDTIGHGTHTASTAAGRTAANASFLGFAPGDAVGIAPKARIAVYKVCWESGCYDSDVLAGIDKAVKDGVDVISLSLGSDRSLPYEIDVMAIASFGAMERGVFISTSAGNSGSLDGSVTNTAPWITTVGASTIDRKFDADLLLDDGTVLTGASLYKGKGLPTDKNLPLVYAGNATTARQRPGVDASTTVSFASLCMPDSIDPKVVRGKIVVCDRGISSRVLKGLTVKKAGGVGVVVANVAPLGEGITSDAHLVPGLSINESARGTLFDYMSSSKNPQATMRFRGTQVGVKPAPIVASFSSRGPNPETIYVLKPDLIAPGVNILAAWPAVVPPTELSDDHRRTEFNIISGTSMSCPHVSGLAALLKGAHPDWSPAMIRSALMTTAYTHDRDGNPLLDEKDYNATTAWVMGAGHVDPVKAVDPGLVYDLTVDDYMEFLCASNFTVHQIKVITRKSVNCSELKKLNPWDLNYPAFSVAFDVSRSSDLKVVVRRTVTYQSDAASTYTVKITNPKRAMVIVDPEKLVFIKKGEKQSYQVEISVENVAVALGNMESEFGELKWSDGMHQVTSPIVVTWHNP